MEVRSVLNAVIGGVVTAALIGLAALVPGLFQRLFALVPAHAVVAFADSCPSIGWHAYGAADGRYIVGVKTDGRVGDVQGIPLATLENRATGKHNHTVIALAIGGTDNQNGLVYPFPGHGGYAKQEKPYPIVDTTYDGKQAVEGTNAPYIQLKFCERE